LEAFGLRIGILLFNEVEELDFAGPLEVFGVASMLKGGIEIVTLSKDGGQVRGRYGLRVQPDFSFDSCPQLDLLIVPGGRGAREQARYDRETLEFAKAQAARAKIASVCTGALVLAEAGILDGKRATTHWSALDMLRKYPKVQVVEGVRFVREGTVATSAGISAGIDLALEIVRELHGDEVASEVAKAFRTLRGVLLTAGGSAGSNEDWHTQRGRGLRRHQCGDSICRQGG
jgi:transcriptional regulator GlxA family with amidase domain